MIWPIHGIIQPQLCTLFWISLCSQQPFPLFSHLPLQQKPDYVQIEGSFHERGGDIFGEDEPLSPPPRQEVIMVNLS